MWLRQHRRDKLTKKNEGPERFRVFVSRQRIGWWNDPRRGKRLGMQVRPGFVSSRDVDWSLGRSLGREPDRSVGWSAGQAADRKADRLQRGGEMLAKMEADQPISPPLGQNILTSGQQKRRPGTIRTFVTQLFETFRAAGDRGPAAFSDGTSAAPARSADLPCASCASCGGRERSDHRSRTGLRVLCTGAERVTGAEPVSSSGRIGTGLRTDHRCGRASRFSGGTPRGRCCPGVRCP